MPLLKVREPFDHPDWLFELKHDGFRALAIVQGHHRRLISRRGHVFKQWPQLDRELAHTVKADRVVLDGEVVCVRPDGSSDFNALLFRRDWPVFYAFDLLQLDDRDLRREPLRTRKRLLRPLVPHGDHWRLRYLDHVRERGQDLYAAACARDTEGVVGKWAGGTYHVDGTRTSWVKIKNPTYTQAEGRHEFFEDRPESRPRWKPAAYRMDPGAAEAW